MEKLAVCANYVAGVRAEALGICAPLALGDAEGAVGAACGAGVGFVSGLVEGGVHVEAGRRRHTTFDIPLEIQRSATITPMGWENCFMCGAELQVVSPCEPLASGGYGYKPDKVMLMFENTVTKQGADALRDVRQLPTYRDLLARTPPRPPRLLRRLALSTSLGPGWGAGRRGRGWDDPARRRGV